MIPLMGNRDSGRRYWIAQGLQRDSDTAGRCGNAGDHGRVLHVAGICLRDGNRRVQDPCRGLVFQSRDLFRGMAILGHYRDLLPAGLVGDMAVPTCTAFTSRAGRSSDTEQASRIKNPLAHVCSLSDVAMVFLDLPPEMMATGSRNPLIELALRVSLPACIRSGM